MSDNETWQVPEGTQPPPPAAAQPPAYGAAQGWTPPPKPGLIPLRPMTLGPLLAASFQVMRRNPRTTLGPALILSALLTIVTALGAAAYVGALSRAGSAATGTDADAIAAGALIVGVLILVAGIAAATVATAVLQAIIVTEVARGAVGEKLRLGQLWAYARGRLGAVVGYTLLIILAAGLAIAVFFGLLVAISAAGAGVGSGSSNSVMGVVFATFGLMLVGMLGGAAIALWLGTRLAFVPAAIVLERLPIRAAIGRSWSLTRGYFWRTLGIMLLVSVMISIASQVVSFPLSLVASLGGTLLFPTGGGPDASGIVVSVIVLLISSLVLAIVTAVGLVLQSATASLLYLDLRMRKEGLDLELSRYVEARQTGADVPDPYLPHATPPAASPWA